jgi:hypothetical protein
MATSEVTLSKGLLPGCLFHLVKSPVMTGENNSQNDNNDCSLFHRTSDKWLGNCNKVTGKLEPFGKSLFHKDIFLSQSLVIV